MKPKYLLYLLPILLIIAANLYWGSVISSFLCIALSGSLLYYAVRLAWEDRVNTVLSTFKRDDARLPGLQVVNEKWKSILGFGLLAIVFAAAVFAVIKTTRPGGNKPWFLNNEHYTISHAGIAGSNIVIFPGKDATSGQIQVSGGGDGATLRFQNCLTPVVAYPGGKQRLLNPVFPQALNKGFTITNGRSTLEIHLEPSKAGFLKSLLGKAGNRTLYTIRLTTNDAALLEDFNLAPPYADQITLEGATLKKGMSLYQLLLDNKSFQSKRSESYQVLEALLAALRDTYIVADAAEEPALHLAPGKGFFEAGYKLLVMGREVAPQLTNTATVGLNERFYVGFNNFRQLLYVAEVHGPDYGIADKSLALMFDFPPHYLLKSPGAQPAGSKNFRFLTNDFNELTSGELSEGFYFQNYNLGSDYRVRGSMEYTSEKPGVPLRAQVQDYLRENTSTAAGEQFSLSTNRPGVSFLFSLRDFSHHGFSTSRIILYLSLTFLLFALIPLFFPGKKVDRIEPVILAVVFALLTLRYLLFWRIGTFPPLENISRYELENTLLGFDFSFMGLNLPVPLTLIWTALFVGFLIWYRRRPRSLDALMPGAKYDRFFRTPALLYRSYAMFIGACLVLFFANKTLLHIEILTRIVSILIPLLGYCYFSMVANRYYAPGAMPLRSGEARLLTEAKAYVFYLFRNPTFVLTLISLAFFALADRGFAILFALFILLKNIFVNFLKHRLDTSKTSFGRMLLKPNNHWVFGLLALVVYLLVLAYKPLFYHLLNNKLWVLFALLAGLLMIFWVILPTARKLRLALGGLLFLFLLLCLIPPTRHFMDSSMSNALKHVSYRAAIISKPLNEMLQEHPYSSFATRKIIETAENQWFINAYISKPYDPGATVNLRPYSKVGVDYPTQTRDVLTARFLVGELGNFTMYLILLLCILPLVLWLTAYRLARTNDLEADKAATVGSYAGLIPLILFFTLALFVWLTSTNRFVFFGQDFPFLSLTSRLSVLLPLLLLAFTLVQQPAPHLSTQINLRANAVKYAFFIGLIAFFALVTLQKNLLNTARFNVDMQVTESHLNKDLNAVLDAVQDSLQNKNARYTYQQLIGAVATSRGFDSLQNKSVQDPYTRSILQNLIDRPSSAFELNNPLFIVYDNGRYQAVYNQNLYLQLPVVESRSVWSGRVLENLSAGDRRDSVVFLSWAGKSQYAALPFYSTDPATGVSLALLPASWIAGATEAVGIWSANPGSKGQHVLYQNKTKVARQIALRYSQTLAPEDVAMTTARGSQYRASFHAQGRSFALNKWVNGRYKIIYPQGADNFWLYHFASGIRAVWSNDSTQVRNAPITLDYTLTQSVSEMLRQHAAPVASKVRGYGFSVIAADGNGNIRLMQDVVNNRQELDPNDEQTIFRLQQQQFFFSNARNERDQWGNRNLIHLYLGPGSSVKPLFSALVASGVNAGWESLQLNPAPGAVSNYGGLALRRPWKNADHYGGIVDMVAYIESSSNFYQGLMMFLGSYTKDDFVRNNHASLGNVLSGEANAYPALQWQGRRYYLPSYNNRKGNWPLTDPAARNRTYFGNNRSLIATGFENNAGLATTENFDDQDRPYFVARGLYPSWQQAGAGFLWAFPEPSYFLQENRAYASIQENFNVGLKTAALGGYPYQTTPFKMLEMYIGMAAYNRNLHLHVNGQGTASAAWQVDGSWRAGAYEGFLARQIFGGMARVISGGSGTAKRLGALKGSHPGLFFYAKTGTINEEASGVKSSRRLVVLASDKDLTQPENIGRAKTFGWFFAVDKTGDFDWNLLLQILEQTMNSQSFKNYFGQSNSPQVGASAR